MSNTVSDGQSCCTHRENAKAIIYVYVIMCEIVT